MKKVPKTAKRIFEDGAYDGRKFQQEVESMETESIIPPSTDAVYEIAGLGGDDTARKCWKLLKGYHRRSLAETTMYRINQLTGRNLRSRERKRQCVEGTIK